MLLVNPLIRYLSARLGGLGFEAFTLKPETDQWMALSVRSIEGVFRFRALRFEFRGTHVCKKRING